MKKQQLKKLRLSKETVLKMVEVTELGYIAGGSIWVSCDTCNVGGGSTCMNEDHFTHHQDC